MSQAEALLDSMLTVTDDENIQTRSIFTEVEPHIVIGIDRKISVPDSLKRIAVQYDHNMRTVTFDCPRYYDGRDMSKMIVYINVAGPIGVRNGYLADNVRVDEYDSNIIHFDWTIKRTITQAKGNLMFLVCIRKANDAGDEENHWNSELNKDLYVSEGLEYDSQTLEEEYPDIVSQLLRRMDNVEINASAEAMQGYANNWLNEHGHEVLSDIQSKGDEILSSIPEDYTAAYNYANEGARTKADAIIRTVDGEVVSVSDSSDDYVRGLRVFGKTTQKTTTGKQLIHNTNTTYSPYGVTYTSNADGSITISGTATGEAYYLFDNAHAIPATGVELIASITGDSSVTMTIGYYTSDTEFVNELVVVNSTKPKTFTYPANAIATRTFLAVSKGKTVNTTVYPMIRLASVEDDSYEPYSGGIASPNPDYPQELVSVENSTVSVYGNNLLPNAVATGTISGVTRTLNANGSITIKGTSTDVHGLIVNSTVELPNGTYAVTGGKPAVPLTIFGESVNGGWVSLSTDSGNGCKFTADDSLYTRYLAQYHMEIGYVFDTTLYPMIRSVAVTDTTYEPYKVAQALDIRRTLPGIPVTSGGNYTDENGQQWICDEVDFERGVYMQRIGIATLHNSYTEYTVLSATGRSQLIVAPTPAKDQSLYGTICNMAIRNNDALSAVHGEYYENPANIVIVGNKGDTENNMRAKYADVKYLYILATPIETPLSAEELDAFKQLRSNYHNTTVLNDASAQMELQYNADTEIYIDNVIKNAMMKVANVTLTAAGWNGTTYGYAQTVTINGVTPNSKIDLQPTPDQLASFVIEGVSLTTSNNNGVVTIHAVGNHPSSDVTIQVQITEVIQA